MVSNKICPSIKIKLIALIEKSVDGNFTLQFLQSWDEEKKG